jgi:hypothetical protein
MCHRMCSYFDEVLSYRFVLGKRICKCKVLLMIGPFFLHNENFVVIAL